MFSFAKWIKSTFQTKPFYFVSLNKVKITKLSICNYKLPIFIGTLEANTDYSSKSK